MRCGIAHAHWFFIGFLSPVFAKKIRHTKYLIPKVPPSFTGIYAKLSVCGPAGVANVKTDKLRDL